MVESLHQGHLNVRGSAEGDTAGLLQLQSGLETETAPVPAFQDGHGSGKEASVRITGMEMKVRVAATHRTDL